MAKKWLLSFMFSYLIFSQLAVTETYHPPKSQLCHFLIISFISWATFPDVFQLHLVFVYYWKMRLYYLSDKSQNTVLLSQINCISIIQIYIQDWLLTCVVETILPKCGGSVTVLCRGRFIVLQEGDENIIGINCCDV